MPSPPINVFRPLYTSGAMADLWTLPADHTLDGAVAYCDDTPVVIYVAYNGAWKTIGGGGVTPAALTKTDDTNVTLTLGGTPSTALLQATSLTLGWAGTLAVPRGGSGAGTFTANGVLLGNSTSAFQVTAAMTDGQILVGQTSSAPLPKTMSGDATLAASGALTIANNAVTTVKVNNAAITLAKIANAAANDKLLGSGNSGSGAAYVEITLGTGLTMTGTTLSASGSVTPAALTRVDDANVTLTLGGTPSTALLQATSLTLGWSGTLSLTRGGSGANLSATGGTSQFVRQNSAGAAFTVSVIAVADLPALNGFTDADWALDDRLPFYDTSATANRDGAATNLLGLTRLAPGGRLTLTSGLPVTTGDVTGATSVDYTPYLDDMICLWDGTRWVWVQFVETTLALGTLASASVANDVFGYLSGGVLALEKLAWTGATTRATAITIQDGRYCKSGDKTRLYLGTFHPTTTTTTEDSKTKRFLWNMYNAVRRPIEKLDTSTASWAYSTASWRQANGDGGNKVEVVIGLAGADVEASLYILADSSVVSGLSIGVGADSTSSPSVIGRMVAPVAAGFVNAFIALRQNPVAGYHYFAWLELGSGIGTQTWYGYSAGAYQSGLTGWFSG